MPDLHTPRLPCCYRPMLVPRHYSPLIDITVAIDGLPEMRVLKNAISLAG